MNTLYKITFGTQLDKNQEMIDLHIIRPDYDQLLDDISSHFGGLTETDHVGHYKHDDGSKVTEESTSIEILGSELDRKLIIAVAEDLKELFNQESVILTETKLNSVFI